MKRWICAVALLSSMIQTDAFADGNQLLKRCQEGVRIADGDKQADLFGAGYCLGVINTVASMRELVNDGAPRSSQICLPPSPTPGQLARIFVKYMKANPEKLHLNESLIAVAALRGAFPCE